MTTPTTATGPYGEPTHNAAAQQGTDFSHTQAIHNSNPSMMFIKKKGASDLFLFLVLETSLEEAASSSSSSPREDLSRVWDAQVR